MIVFSMVGESAAELYFWLSLLGGGALFWTKKVEPERLAQEQAREAERRRQEYEAKRKKQAREAERQRREYEAEREKQARADTEALRWRRESQGRQSGTTAFRPAPATVEPSDSGMAPLGLVGIPLPSRPDLVLPDPEQVRRLCAEVVAGLVRSVAKEADAHAARLRPLAASGLPAGRYRARTDGRGWGRVQQGRRLTAEADRAVRLAVAWADARSELLADLHEQAAAEVRALREHGGKLQKWCDTPDRAYDAPGTPVRPDGELETFLRRLTEDLAAAARRLRALPPYEAPLRLSPPGVARVRADTVAEAVEDRISEYVERHARRLVQARPGSFSMDARDWGEGADLLKDFLTVDIRQRFDRTTEGFRAVSRWDDTSAAPHIRSRMHRIFVSLSLNYMVEVLKSMPEYADHSGENVPKSNITIQAGVVQIANTLNNIGSNVAAVMQRGDTQSAEAINALSAAVQADPDLDPQGRAEQLENVAEVAEAMADPDAGGNRRRGRNALAALTAAVSASSQVTQAIGQWQHVFSSLN
ncbi:hypothetical protein ACFXDJ_28455 [Streptomyces sp. NPDC059443]|uniref:hypothetical protein n=1 Tax=unclassified Streptomyces TaxID=2593676 RepID=UPI00369322F2